MRTRRKCQKKLSIKLQLGKGYQVKLLKERGTLKESIEWGGRNMDKKESKLVGIVDDDESKEPC